jgi:hypothetical protein
LDSLRSILIFIFGGDEGGLRERKKKKCKKWNYKKKLIVLLQKVCWGYGQLRVKWQKFLWPTDTLENPSRKTRNEKHSNIMGKSHYKMSNVDVNGRWDHEHDHFYWREEELLKMRKVELT